MSESYKLYDLTNDNDDDNDDNSNDDIDNDDSKDIKSDNDTDKQSLLKALKAKRKREKRKQKSKEKKARIANNNADTNPTSIITTLDTNPTNVITTLDNGNNNDATNTNKIDNAANEVRSTWLSKFLATSRECVIIPPPELQANSDLYLQEFFQRNENHKDNENDENDDDCDDENIDNENDNNDNKNIKNDTTTTTNAAKTTDNPESHSIKLFNLPYRITAEQLINIAKGHGVIFKSITLHVDKKTNLPAGNGVGYLDLQHHDHDDSINDCVEALQGQDFGGRPLRVHSTASHDIVSKMRKSSQGVLRYFGNDISVKCLNCGEVGHKQVDCNNDALPIPCHLCAGKDHDAGDCPNITCYRCGIFGHHSRKCNNVRMQKAILCTLCGSSTHDNRHCHYTDLSEKVESKYIRCMVCNKYGHANCIPLEPPKNKNLFCPNCGLKGHHVDYPNLSSHTCQFPRYEAYMRFNQLLRDVDEDLGDVDDRNAYYRQLLRSTNGSDQMLQLFPSLLNSNSTRYDSCSTRYDNGSTRYDSGSTKYDNGSSRYDNGSSRYDNGSSRYDNGSRRNSYPSNDYDRRNNHDDYRPSFNSGDNRNQKRNFNDYSNNDYYDDEYDGHSKKKYRKSLPPPPPPLNVPSGRSFSYY